jgi:tRNA (guanine-N7-)-methyltransferase
LHLDIGCGKGGFLLDMAVSDVAKSYNYLGLEIRPLVASYARERVILHDVAGHLDYLGCNANVDLRRILSRYHQQQESDDATDSPPRQLLQRVSIQFPDPHYKSKRAKRRVVTRELVNTLAASMPTDGTGIIFLQSDVQSMLDDMRFRFRESPVYFKDSLEDMTEYVPDNMMGVATEREVSVLKQGLPVYRCVFTRTAEPYVAEDSELPPLEL